jgi:hypothetical protein
MRTWLTLLSKARRLTVIAVGGLALAACAPLTPGPPFHFLETSRVLDKDKVAVTLGAGGGSGGWDGAAAGGTARVRVGIGHQSEIGIEGAGVWVNHGWAGAQKYVEAPSGAFLGKLAYKWAPAKWFALLAGAGGSRSATGLGLGADLGFVLTLDRWAVKPYLGGRFSFGVPVDHPVHADGGVTPALIGAVGLSVPAGPARVLFEGGLVGAWSERAPTDAHPFWGWDTHGAAYGALAVEIPLH